VKGTFDTSGGLTIGVAVGPVAGAAPNDAYVLVGDASSIQGSLMLAVNASGTAIDVVAEAGGAGGGAGFATVAGLGFHAVALVIEPSGDATWYVDGAAVATGAGLVNPNLEVGLREVGPAADGWRFDDVLVQAGAIVPTATAGGPGSGSGSGTTGTATPLDCTMALSPATVSLASIASGATVDVAVSANVFATSSPVSVGFGAYNFEAVVLDASGAKVYDYAAGKMWAQWFRQATIDQGGLPFSITLTIDPTLLAPGTYTVHAQSLVDAKDDRRAVQDLTLTITP
jgi:hypothetical protein